jgi:hypothetical protein
VKRSDELLEFTDPNSSAFSNYCEENGADDRTRTGDPRPLQPLVHRPENEINTEKILSKI